MDSGMTAGAGVKWEGVEWACWLRRWRLIEEDSEGVRWTGVVRSRVRAVWREGCAGMSALMRQTSKMVPRVAQIKVGEVGMVLRTPGF